MPGDVVSIFPIDVEIQPNPVFQLKIFPHNPPLLVEPQIVLRASFLILPSGVLVVLTLFSIPSFIASPVLSIVDRRDATVNPFREQAVFVEYVVDVVADAEATVVW